MVAIVWLYGACCERDGAGGGGAVGVEVDSGEARGRAGFWSGVY